jgi:kynurenine formamidase
VTTPPTFDVAVRPVKTLENDGINTMILEVADHVGTHIDAPIHIIEGGAGIADLPLERCFGPGVVLDVRRGPDEAVTVEDLAGAEPCIEEGDIVLLDTGWSGYVGTPDYSQHHPYLDEAAAGWLVDRGVSMVGIDASSVDMPHSLRPSGFKHGTLRVLLEAGVPALHGLANLGAVRGQRCTIAAFPIVFAGADAGPARVVALLD